jgi:23S rRNA (guanosine2251-2'-O)-methyltransferase
MTHPKNAAPVPPSGERVIDRTTSGPSEARRGFRQTPADASTPLRANVPEPAAGYEGIRLPAAVLLDNVRSMYNVGAFFRAADGVGLEKVCLCGITAHPPKKAISKTALGAEEVVAWEHDWDAIHMAERMRRRGFEIAAIETSWRAVDLFDWQPRFPVCVAFGNEVEGLRPELLEIADAHVRIPMLGQKTSLNVATAAGIVLYELLRKFRILRMNAEPRQ